MAFNVLVSNTDDHRSLSLHFRSNLFHVVAFDHVTDLDVIKDVEILSEPELTLATVEEPRAVEEEPEEAEEAVDAADVPSANGGEDGGEQYDQGNGSR